ncbi:MAG: hypothetical protein GFH27_549293n344 [Chloroflexi bacterium AL-W]|nr:hypothetical protein [Chloroflexi bacterium AL-N1]NOK67541.1 hypothetical protein [Chloroflexi bacterium AL-N10]NOK75689.1 hypothetical protein [Chloroflexi bacterium AL-N5]NOK82477.1 hypothetical protein [Chloroflexi bacterium AL-W]NOK90322.1 hypothetical protein [Chloroflexi bacterium AL-N15]
MNDKVVTSQRWRVAAQLGRSAAIKNVLFSKAGLEVYKKSEVIQFSFTTQN